MSKDVEPPDRNLHGEDEKKVADLSREAGLEVNLGNVERAIELFKEYLQVCNEVQMRENRPVHKGGPLYSIGMLQLFQTEDEYKRSDTSGVKSRLERALTSILLAYIEDILNTALGREIEAEILPACLNLKQLFDMESAYLAQVGTHVHSWKTSRRWHEAFDPQVILNEVIEKHGRPAEHARVLQAGQIPHIIPRQPIGFPQPWDRRVFVGGNYLEQMAIIQEIAGIVGRLGFVPVVMARTIIPEGRTHHHSLMILHTCKYAIIDVSGEAGQLMELERTIDYEIKPLVLLRRSYSTIGKLSDMVRTWRNEEPIIYDDSSLESTRRTLEQHVTDYLSQSR